MKTYLKSTMRIVLFAACMGGLTACSDDSNYESTITKTGIKRIDNTDRVTQITGTVDGVKVTGKLVADDAVSIEFVNRTLTGSVAGNKVQLAGKFKKDDKAGVKSGTLYNGTTKVNGVEVVYVLYESEDAPVIAGGLYELSNKTKTWAELTLGEKASKLPTGTHDYSGFNKIYGEFDLDGKFDMTVDFSGKRITKFVATTAYSKVEGTDIPVDLAPSLARHDVTRRMDAAYPADLVLTGRLTRDEPFEVAADLAHDQAKKAYRL